MSSLIGWPGCRISYAGESRRNLLSSIRSPVSFILFFHRLLIINGLFVIVSCHQRCSTDTNFYGCLLKLFLYSRRLLTESKHNLSSRPKPSTSPQNSATFPLLSLFPSSTTKHTHPKPTLSSTVARLQLGRLHEVHEIYKEVLHDSIK